MKTKDSIPVKIDAGIFNDVYLPHLENMARIQIFYGGAASGKSVFLAQRTIADILRGGRNYLVCRQEGKYIRGTVFREIKKVIKAWGLSSEFKIHKTDMTITCTNGYQILFAGLGRDEASKLKSITPDKGVLTNVWVEEATEATQDSIKQLEKRLRGIEIGKEPKPKTLTLSFNPILKSHWIYKEYFKDIAWTDEQTEHNDGKLSILKTTYTDNRFLAADDIEGLKSESDKYYYDVYTLGIWGVLGDVIFTNIKVQDLSETRDTFDNHRHGLDFGYGEPLAYVHTHLDKKRKRLYVLDDFTSQEMQDEDLYDEISPIVERQRITADSAEPKSIAKLKKLGLDIVGAKKGKDSVIYGIKWLKGYTIIIDVTCIAFKTEFEILQWKTDRYGERLEEVAGRNKHFFDALRYAHENDMDERELARFVEVKGL